MGSKKMKAPVISNEGHSSLRRKPALFLMSTIIDPGMEHDTDVVLQTIATKFSIDKGHIDHMEGALAGRLIDLGGYNNIDSVMWQASIEGDVRILYEASEYSYVTTAGKRHSVRFNETVHLEVNGRIIESRVYDSNAVSVFIDDMETLFSVAECPDRDYTSIFEQAWGRLEKGNKWDARDQMMAASFLIAGNTPERGSKEFFEVLYDGFRFITNKWFLYLWDMHEQNRPEEYILSLKSFVSKHQESWAGSKRNKEVINKIYTAEHEDMRNAFLREDDELYIPGLFRILALWERTHQAEGGNS